MTNDGVCEDDPLVYLKLTKKYREAMCRHLKHKITSHSINLLHRSPLFEKMNLLNPSELLYEIKREKKNTQLCKAYCYLGYIEHIGQILL